MNEWTNELMSSLKGRKKNVFKKGKKEKRNNQSINQSKIRMKKERIIKMEKRKAKRTNEWLKWWKNRKKERRK